MYSPKELEEEVDHSFFDSDCEGNTSEEPKDAHFNKQNDSETKQERTNKEFSVSKDQLKGAFQNGIKHEEGPSLECSSKHKDAKYKRGHHSSVSSSSKSSLDKKHSSKGSSVSSYSSDEEREREGDLRSSVDVKSKNEDGYHNSTNENEEKVRSVVKRSTKQKPSSLGTSSKSAGKSLKFSRSHSSTDSESSDSCKGRKSLSPVKPSEQQQIEVTDSEDTVTDVTPLSSPNMSPSQSIDVSADVHQQPGVTDDKDAADGHGSLSSEGEDEPVEKQLDRVVVISSPGSMCSSRKNYSFTNDEVRKIDQENHRLLRELSRASAGSRCASSACSKSSSRRSSEAPTRLYHTALNRQREQERIQKENLAFLKRLEAVKPTPGMTRDEQLSDYQQQCRYLGTRNTTIPSVRLKSSRSSGRTSRPGISPRKTGQGISKPPRVMPRPAWS
ncbi:hypothetical protein DNTS_004021 [Danionella cerebrum]|uniref:Cilia- and flagella-associated protein 97 n=1 Tax=Danionella cerebrum TaxID=2873325 RepID=A0A553Q4R3_9TELE|nr:hypothetical protein DNTS_004021 [Danionella translucida]